MKNKFLIPLVCILFFVALSAVDIFAYETTYTYDNLNRLTSATYNDGTGHITATYQYDLMGNRLLKIVKLILPGDIDGDSAVTLADAIITMQIISGITLSQAISLNAAVNADGKIGLREAVFILQKAAGLR